MDAAMNGDWREGSVFRTGPAGDDAVEFRGQFGCDLRVLG
jgi:hypothetical protein